MKIKNKELKIGDIVILKTINEESWPKGEKEYIGWIVGFGIHNQELNIPGKYIVIQFKRRESEKHHTFWASFWNDFSYRTFTEDRIKEIEVLKGGKNG